jgi:hypothetical protein
VRHCLYHVRRGPPHLGRYPSPPESHGSPFFPVQGELHRSSPPPAAVFLGTAPSPCHLNSLSPSPGPGGPWPSLVARRPPLERRHRPHLGERRRYLASVRCRATW